MKKNIMFILPTLIGGGAEKTVANLSKYLNEKYNVYIVVMKDTPTKYSYAGNLIVLKDYFSNGKVKKVYTYIKQIKELKKIKKEYNISCSISFLLQADLINVLSRQNEKIFVSIRNKDSRLWNKKLKQIIIKFTLTQCDRIISISKQVKDDIIENFKINPNKIVTIYNPSMISEFGDYKNGLDEKLFIQDRTIINTGRLTQQKGQWHLIRAFSIVVKKIPDARLLILGEGNLNNYLNKMICDLNLENNIKLVGFVNNPYDYMKKSDIFVFPSLYEGLGNSILEALACGLPIISSDCECGPREILSPKTDYHIKVIDNYEKSEYGILVPVCDGKYHSATDKLTKEEKILASSIIELLVNKNLRNKYKNKASERIKDFDILKIIDEWSSEIEK